MIASFRDDETRRIFLTGKSRKFGVVARAAARRLGDIDIAQDVQELRNPPGNHLEKLSGDRLGQWSIRIIDQYRVCFEWDGKDAQNVEVVDYH